MSFGSIGNPINQDNGDNGTGAESRLVNNATYDHDIACIVAAGNDGKQELHHREAQMAQLQSVRQITPIQSTEPMISWHLIPIQALVLVTMMMTTGTN